MLVKTIFSFICFTQFSFVGVYRDFVYKCREFGFSGTNTFVIFFHKCDGSKKIRECSIIDLKVKKIDFSWFKNVMRTGRSKLGIMFQVENTLPHDYNIPHLLIVRRKLGTVVVWIIWYYFKWSPVWLCPDTIEMGSICCIRTTSSCAYITSNRRN